MYCLINASPNHTKLQFSQTTNDPSVEPENLNAKSNPPMHPPQNKFTDIAHAEQTTEIINKNVAFQQQNRVPFWIFSVKLSLY